MMAVIVLIAGKKSVILSRIEIRSEGWEEDPAIAQFMIVILTVQNAAIAEENVKEFLVVEKLLTSCIYAGFFILFLRLPVIK